MLSQGPEIFRVRREDRAPGFCEGHNERVDGGSFARSAAELCSSASERFRQLLDDITRLEKTVGLRVAPGISLQALDQDKRRDGRRPKPLAPKSQDQGGRAR